LGAFTHALRDGRSYKNNITPKANSIRAAIDCVAQTHRMADRLTHTSTRMEKLHSFYNNK
ncbi:MAG: hypothetical protein ACK55I_40655, partial [bacterium]